MDARFYNSEEIDFEKLATDLENMFRMQGYEVQHFGNNDQMMVQLKKGGDLIALIGLQTALSVTFQRTSGGSAALVGAQKWVDKAAVGAVGLIAFPVLWPLMITAGAGAVKQAALSNQVLGTVDSLVMQQVPGTHAGPMPGTLVPQFQQYWGTPPPQYAQPQYVPPTPAYVPNAPVYTPPAPAKPRCPTCNTHYEPGDTFCSGCGRALTPPKRVCTSCKTEVKPGVAFCPSCGASTFQATTSQPVRSSAPEAPPKPATPVYKPSPKPTYTPPKPATPVYKPPTTPTYTPPKPVTPVYTPPPTYTPPPKPPEPQPYVPPVPKDPLVMPQPSITLIPGKPRPVTPPPPPPVPVYIPSNPAQPPTISATPPQSAPTIQARPTNDASAAWGVLSFNNGREFTLAGERILVGRYDHDLGGVEPEVDLGSMEGADTVSRAHATIEHVGNSSQLTDLGSTNFTRLNSKRLDANVPLSINDGDTLQFGKITCTFKKM